MTLGLSVSWRHVFIKTRRHRRPYLPFFGYAAVSRLLFYLWVQTDALGHHVFLVGPERENLRRSLTLLPEVRPMGRPGEFHFSRSVLAFSLG